MISTGLRPWRKYTSLTFRRYCTKYDFDFHLVTDEKDLMGPCLAGLVQSEGRRNKHIYAGKSYIAWKFLQEKGYRRVAIVDDSCSIAPTCPDVFEAVPEGTLGGTQPPPSVARESFDFIVRHRTAAMLPELNVKDYVRSGLLVYSRDIAGVIAPFEIEKHADLLNSPLPHQTLTYYLCKTHQYPIFSMDDMFLCLPKPEDPNQNRRLMHKVSVKQLRTGHAWAVSGVYRHRYLIVSDISIKLIREWDKQCRGAAAAHTVYLINRIRRRCLWLGLWSLELGRRVRLVRWLYRTLGLSITPQRRVI